jgi:hypothetical protein
MVDSLFQQFQVSTKRGQHQGNWQGPTYRPLENHQQSTLSVRLKANHFLANEEVAASKLQNSFYAIPHLNDQSWN